MFFRLLVTCFLLITVVQSALTNNPKGQSGGSIKAIKQEPQYYDYDLNDQKFLGNVMEGSGGAASLDEYADDEDEEELPKVIENMLRSSTTSSTTPSSTTLTTTTTTTIRTTETSTLFLTPRTKSTLNYESRIEKTRGTTPTMSVFNDLDGSEFKEDNEEYVDDLEDDIEYSDFTVTNKVSTSLYTTPKPTMATATRYVLPTARNPSIYNDKAPIWVFFKFLTSSHIAIGILVCLIVGILTSIILLICIIQRYHKREKSHSSYTTGLLYPHQYGYSKAPQEFYA